ncbi:MAG: hypothetical protein H6Q17_500 [Bacteroidetes bacterium]|nr:hypothetical protein [Bacteroidota bacterium]
MAFCMIDVLKWLNFQPCFKPNRVYIVLTFNCIFIIRLYYPLKSILS